MVPLSLSARIEQARQTRLDATAIASALQAFRAKLLSSQPSTLFPKVRQTSPAPLASARRIAPLPGKPVAPSRSTEQLEPVPIVQQKVANQVEEAPVVASGSSSRVSGAGGAGLPSGLVGVGTGAGEGSYGAFDGAFQGLTRQGVSTIGSKSGSVGGVGAAGLSYDPLPSPALRLDSPLVKFARYVPTPVDPFSFLSTDGYANRYSAPGAQSTSTDPQHGPNKQAPSPLSIDPDTDIRTAVESLPQFANKGRSKEVDEIVEQFVSVGLSSAKDVYDLGEESARAKLAQQYYSASKRYVGDIVVAVGAALGITEEQLVERRVLEDPNKLTVYKRYVSPREWTPKVDQHLRELLDDTIKDRCKQDWDAIALALGKQAADCEARCRILDAREPDGRVWSSKEDDHLLDLIFNANEANRWNGIAKEMHPRSLAACAAHYRTLEDSEGWIPDACWWTPEEDDHLLDLIFNANVAYRWDGIAKEMHPRSLEACRAHYRTLVGSEGWIADACWWTPEDDKKLLDLIANAHEAYRWKEITEEMYPRSLAACAAHYRTLVGKEGWLADACFWTDEDREKLISIVGGQGAGDRWNWDQAEIDAMAPHSLVACKEYFYRVLKTPVPSDTPWTADEQNYLVVAVNNIRSQGQLEWELVADMVETAGSAFGRRTAIACHTHYYRLLNAWSDAMVTVLLQRVAAWTANPHLGPSKWQFVAEGIPNKDARVCSMKFTEVQKQQAKIAARDARQLTRAEIKYRACFPEYTVDNLLEHVDPSTKKTLSHRELLGIANDLRRNLNLPIKAASTCVNRRPVAKQIIAMLS